MMPTTTIASPADELSKIIQNYQKDKPGSLLKLLEQAQEVDPRHYLSEKTLRTVAQAARCTTYASVFCRHLLLIF